MPPMGTEKKVNISSFSTGSHGLKRRSSSKNLAPNQNFCFFLHSVFFLKGAYEMELGTIFKVCQENHYAFSGYRRRDFYFPSYLTNIKFLASVSWAPHTSSMALPASSFHFVGTASKTLGMHSVRPCLHRPRFEGCNRMKVFKPRKSASSMCSVSNEMLPCGSPCSLCWVSGWLSRDAA